MRQVREEECFRRTPQGRGLAEQFAGELRAGMQELPHEELGYYALPDAQLAFLLRCMWIANEGSGLLRKALSKVQEVWRPASGQGEPTLSRWAVRRLTPKEAARLQGFEDGYLDITYRGKPAADGPKYKALGNSMAVPVMRWIGEADCNPLER
jgi:site-specific DNA-cytosine methylase